MNSWVEIFQMAFLLFLFITPASAVALVLVSTPRANFQQRMYIANRASVYAFLLLLPFCFAGPLLFDVLHVGVPAFRITGGIILIFSGMGMLLPSNTPSSDGSAPVVDITFVPLTFPFMSGPGTITLVLTKAVTLNFMGRSLLCVAIALALLGIWVCFYLGFKAARFMTPTMVKLAERLTGVFILTLAVQCIVVGLDQAGFTIWS